MGSPAFDYNDYYKSYAVFKKLPDINQRLREFEIKLQKVQSNSLSVD